MGYGKEDSSESEKEKEVKKIEGPHPIHIKL